MQNSQTKEEDAGSEKLRSREVLLQAAGQLMTERGSLDISLSDIARRANLNGALVRYYFGSKSGLLLALLNDVIGKGIEQMRGLVMMDLDPVEKLRIHVKGIVQLYFRYPFVNRLVHLMLDDPEMGPKIAESISRPLAETQRQLLEEGIAKGRFKPTDPMLFYFIVLGACDQIFVARHVLRVAFGVEGIDDDLQRRYAATLLDVLLKGLLV